MGIGNGNIGFQNLGNSDGGGSQNLQQTCDNGNTTDTDIVLNDNVLGGKGTSIYFGQGISKTNFEASTVALGNEAGSGSNGAFTIAIGEQAAKNSTSSADGHVVAIGYQAGSENTGSYSQFIGSGAGKNNTGNQVVGIGQDAANNNQSDNVIAIGTSAANNNQSGNVIAIGTSAAQNNGGQNVVAIGTSAAQNNGGQNVVAIGTSAALNNTASNVVCLGNDSSVNGFDNTVAVGQNSVANYTGSVAIGYNSSAAAGGGSAISIGYGATSDDNGVSIGEGATNLGGISIGSNSGNNTFQAICIGNNAQANNQGQIVFKPIIGEEAIRYDTDLIDQDIQRNYINQPLGNEIVTVFDEQDLDFTTSSNKRYIYTKQIEDRIVKYRVGVYLKLLSVGGHVNVSLNYTDEDSISQTISLYDNQGSVNINNTGVASLFSPIDILAEAGAGDIMVQIKADGGSATFNSSVTIQAIN